MNFIKQVLVIENKEWTGKEEIVTERGDGFHGEFDMDELSGTLSFTLPYIDKRNEEYNQDCIEIQFKSLIKKWCPIRLYANMFETGIDNAVDLYHAGLLKQVFVGFVNTVNLSRSKTSYTFNITCTGSLSFIANELCLPVAAQQQIFTGVKYFNFILIASGGSVYIKTSDLLNNVNRETELVPMQWVKSSDIKEILSTLKDDFGIRAHQQGDGKVNIFDLLFYFDKGLEEGSVPAWEFKLGDTMFNLDYGDLTGDVQMVECVAYDTVGYAIDPTAISLKGLSLTKNPSDPNLYNKVTIYRSNITSKSDAELAAKNYLLELSKNNVVSFQTVFNPDICVADFITVDDGELYSNQLMIIKHYTFDISKTACHMNITAYRGVLGTQPERFINSVTGITDLDMIKVRKNVEDVTGWNDFKV